MGSLDELKYPMSQKEALLITASRLATEKHCDWLVEAVVKAKKACLTFHLTYMEGWR
ncbi:MAG: hypothetical protein ACLRI8_08805 [Agathobacter rectalis]